VPIRTLLIDDEAPAISYLERLLGEREEIEMIGVARDGKQAIDAIDRLRPDLIFLDIEMPGVSGFEILRRIRHKPIVVLVTGHAEYRAMAYETDALAYLCKPVEADQIRHVIEKIERMRELLKGAGAAKKPRPES
jgi:DNA-binding LytR/AlgR family response regulator